MNGAKTVLITDADNREVLEYDGNSGAVLRWYAYGLGANDVLGQMNVPANTRVGLLPDIQGSVIGTVDGGMGVLTSFAYRPYGAAATAPSQFGYTGQRTDGETALYYYRARHYHPVWGRFLQPDPAGYKAGTNLYSYVANDPLNSIDPLGLASVPVQTQPQSSPAVGPFAQTPNFDSGLPPQASNNPFYPGGIPPAQAAPLASTGPPLIDTGMSAQPAGWNPSNLQPAQGWTLPIPTQTMPPSVPGSIPAPTVADDIGEIELAGSKSSPLRCQAVDCGAPTGGVTYPLCSQCNDQLKSGAARRIILENGRQIRKPVDED